MARVVPPIEDALRLLQQHFFARTDEVAILPPERKPFPVAADGILQQLLRAHVLGDAAPPVTIRYSSKRVSKAVLRQRFRVGSYTVTRGGKTRWLCFDLDGKGHASALADPIASARVVCAAFESRGLPAYLERSGGGHGWHVWCFFDEPVSAKDVRRLAFALASESEPLADGGVAHPRKGKGIEVFPKQSRARGGRGLGNLVWLPWWHGAPDGANVFYRFAGDGRLEPFVPEAFEAVSRETLDTLLAELPEEPLEGRTRSAPEVASREELASAPEWKEWRERALAALPLEAVYGSWLTGNPAGVGWLECRDPESPSGDRSPSASVADGSGEAPRGSFHSFRSGETKSVFDFLVDHGGAADFGAAVRQVADMSGVPLPRRGGGKSATGRTGRRIGGYRLPEIQVNSRQLRDVVADGWEAMHAANESPKFPSPRRPFLFRRSGSIVHLKARDTAEKEALLIEEMDEAAVFGLLARVADWTRVTSDAVLDRSPSREVAGDMLAYPDQRLQVLESVIATPVFGKSGSLITEPGYHSEDRLWLEPCESLAAIEVPENPTASEVEAARALLLEELLVDFPFVSESDRAHAVAAMILPFVRRLIDGCTPIHLVEAPSVGSGKGLLCNLIAIPATGAGCDGRVLPTQEDEARKMLTAELATGRAFIQLDNAREQRKLDCPPLAAVITATSWTDRILGKSAMVTLPNRAVWLVTGNNPSLSMEIARRCVRIRIDPAVDRPWRRSEFKHRDIQGWAKEHRERLVRAILLLVRAWMAADRPLHDTRLGSFESWSAVLGGILEVAGIRGFLDCLEELYEAADVDGQMWREFTASWWEAFRDLPKKASELNEHCEEQDLMLSVRGDGTTRSQQIRLGKALQGAKDRVFGGLRITRIRPRTKHERSPSYKVAPWGGGEEEPAAPDSCESCECETPTFAATFAGANGDGDGTYDDAANVANVSGSPHARESLSAPTSPHAFTRAHMGSTPSEIRNIRRSHVSPDQPTTSDGECRPQDIRTAFATFADTEEATKPLDLTSLDEPSAEEGSDR